MSTHASDSRRCSPPDRRYGLRAPNRRAADPRRSIRSATRACSSCVRPRRDLLLDRLGQELPLGLLEDVSGVTGERGGREVVPGRGRRCTRSRGRVGAARPAAGPASTCRCRSARRGRYARRPPRSNVEVAHDRLSAVVPEREPLRSSRRRRRVLPVRATGGSIARSPGSQIPAARIASPRSGQDVVRAPESIGRPSRPRARTMSASGHAGRPGAR